MAPTVLGTVATHCDELQRTRYWVPKILSVENPDYADRTAHTSHHQGGQSAVGGKVELDTWVRWFVFPGYPNIHGCSLGSHKTLGYADMTNRGCMLGWR